MSDAEHELGIIGVADHPDRQRLDRSRRRRRRRTPCRRRRAAPSTSPSIDSGMPRFVGKHAALEKGVERAGERREGAGDDEADPLHAPPHDADRLGAQRSNRAARAAHSRTARTVITRKSAIAAARLKRERQPIKMRGRGGPGARPDADDAVVAAGDVGPLIGDRPGDLREGERQHGEIDAGEAHAEPAEDERAGEAEQHARRRAPPPCRARTVFSASAAP